jgi:hypothetical protein
MYWQQDTEANNQQLTTNNMSAVTIRPFDITAIMNSTSAPRQLHTNNLTSFTPVPADNQTTSAITQKIPTMLLPFQPLCATISTSMCYES